VRELYTLAEAYDMPAEPVDAMDVEIVHEAVSRAADRARRGDGPTFLEFKTYRFRGHSMSDPQKYRTKEEVAEWKQRDPVELIRERILVNGIATEAELDAIDEKIKIVVDESVVFAEASPFPEAHEAYEDVYVQKDYPFVME
jgi:pyruvate dehydrogenase E1 component alpha subunit